MQVRIINDTESAVYFRLKKEKTMATISGKYVTKGDVAALYNYKIDEHEIDMPALMKWAIAVEFCNDLSLKQGLNPCYYLDGKLVDCTKGNYNIRGNGYECRTKNNGWRIPTRKELSHLSVQQFTGLGEKWLWTNDKEVEDDSKEKFLKKYFPPLYNENRIIVRPNKHLTEFLEFDNKNQFFDTDEFYCDPENKLALITIRTMYKDDFAKKPKTVL